MAGPALRRRGSPAVRIEQLEKPIGDLSGGEQPRVCIAQLIVQPADLLLLDEPADDLDIR